MARTFWQSSALLVLCGALSWGCGDDDDFGLQTCRFQPGLCAGGAGAFCGANIDCAPGLFCCTDKGNCGGGMCTFECKRDADCPFDMLCEHDMCFYACASDLDCAQGMRCEHGHTICEYP